MKRCKLCYMPDTRPNTPFKDGICQACINHDVRVDADSNKHNEELMQLADKYRSVDKGIYDCIIPVSGGKNSYFQVKTVKEEMNMNPLLVTVCDPFTKSKAGNNNIDNIAEVFGCDHIRFIINPDVFKRVTRLYFEEFADPLRYVETAIGTYPYLLASQLKIPLIIYGEGEFEYGNGDNIPDANGWIDRKFKDINCNWLKEKGFTDNDLIPVAKKDFDFHPKCIFLGYYKNWSSMLHYRVALRYGFQDLYHEWQREGYIEHFEQIDSIGYIVHLWLKYPKFGFQRICDIVSRRIRYGLMPLEKGKKIIDDGDWKIDQRAMDDFCDTLGYTRKQFWGIVERFWNKDIFDKDEYGIWKLKR